MKIFNIQTAQDFDAACLETFRYQYENVTVYRQFVDFLNINPERVSAVEEIPFLPIEMFKNHTVLDQNKTAHFYFQSSGTTQANLSKHWIAEEKLYQESLYKSFEHFIGKPRNFVFLGLLPNYLERQNSSLVYMVDFLMKQSARAENGYYLYNHLDLYRLLLELQAQKQPTILFGVSFALLDYLDTLKAENLEAPNFPELKIIETGGMKGRKEEITKDELLSILKKAFKTQNIFSEYSMTELLSQAYSLGDNIYQTPAWMRILIRNTEDPFSYVADGKTGAINIIDLANRHSCSFIATQDLGKINPRYPFAFEVLGRIDHSDIRGCSLLVS